VTGDSTEEDMNNEASSPAIKPLDGGVSDKPKESVEQPRDGSVSEKDSIVPAQAPTVTAVSREVDQSVSDEASSASAGEEHGDIPPTCPDNVSALPPLMPLSPRFSVISYPFLLSLSEQGSFPGGCSSLGLW
jgi:hypothetical protein